MKNTPTAASARMSRERSSSRCEISVPSASFSGSSLMGWGIGRGGVRADGGLRCERSHRGCGGLIGRRTLQILRFLLELIAELARHGARVAEPAADEGGNLRQFVRAQNDQGDHKNDQQFRKTALEHGGLSRSFTPAGGLAAHQAGRSRLSAAASRARASENSASVL